MERIRNDRSFLTYILLGAITLGIYPIWFLHHLAKDVNVLCEKDGKKTPGVLVYLFLGILTLGIYSIIWWASVADRLRVASREYEGLYNTPSGADVMPWFIAGIFIGVLSWMGMYKVFESANAVSTAYNQRNGYFT